MSPVIEQICRMSKTKKNYCFFYYLFSGPSFRLWWYAVILIIIIPDLLPVPFAFLHGSSGLRDVPMKIITK